jgi:ABC-type transport system involved in cytochrome c biogenesis permease component
MTFLPVVERELRVAARRRGTYRGRFVAGLIGSLLAAWILLTGRGMEKDAGADLFMVVSVVVFLYAAVAGTLVTCDCLSEEKREGTLGLLFLTDLKGHDVVLGKLAATSVNAFYGMLALVPMLAIPFIVGGVARDEMLRVVLVSINLLFFFLSAGLFASAVCRKDNRALVLAILIGLALVLGGPVLSLFRFCPDPQAALCSSPAAGCFLAFDASNTLPPPRATSYSWFWCNAAATNVYGWIFFGLACWLTPRSWQDAALSAKPTAPLAGSPVRRARVRRALLDINPFLWRVARSGRKQLPVWLTLLALAALWTWTICVFSLVDDFGEDGIDLILLAPAGLVLKAWLAAEASRTFSEDRRSGGLELLLSTPLDEKEIVRGQRAALWRQFGPPTLALLVANFMFLSANVWWWSAEIRMDLLALHLVLGGFLAADMIALSWVGMWLGLNNRKPNRAALLAMTRVVALPVMFYVVFMSFWTLTPSNNRNNPEGIASVLWVATGLAADFYFGLRAKGRLLAEFRTIASEGGARTQAAEPVPATAAILMEAP